MFGTAPVLWWIPFPLTSVGRATVLLAVTAAWLGGWIACGHDPRSRFRRLLPRVQAIDALPLIAAALSAATLINFLKSRTAEESMTLLAMSWDNSSHFDMYYMVRQHGQILGALGPSPDGSPWHFHNYPQGFHAVVALLAEIVRGPAVSGPGGELVSYTVLSAVASVLAVTMVAAALCSLPAFRRRFLVAAPAVAVVTAGWIYGPGAAATLHGFQNFYLAAALVAAFLVLMVLQVRVLRPLTLFAASAAAIGVVHNWALLATLLLGAAAGLVLPWNRRRWAGTRRVYVLAAVIAVFTVLAVVPALGQLSSIDAEDVLYAVGGVPAPDYGMAGAIVIGSVGVALAVSRRAPRGRSGLAIDQTKRTAATAWAVVTGLIVVVLMAAPQISASGQLSYYGIKYLLALELVALVVLGMGVVSLVGPARQGSPKAGWASVTSTLLVSAAATQVFGLTLDTRSVGLTPSSASALELERQRKTLDAPVPAHIHALLAAAESNGGEPAVYLTTYGTEFDPVLAAQWFAALTGTYTEKTVTLISHVVPLSAGLESVPDVVRALRTAHPEANIVVDPRNSAWLQQLLAERR
ncbi:hypothetical protein [Arthrobacter sp. UYCu712]|uniref:hypothetical protein n=1 Tax=Arthrobacter sp. UYCu712 TaxID=3156340 RepID=UPI003399A21A